jgi:hypothetical protein
LFIFISEIVIVTAARAERGGREVSKSNDTDCPTGQ